MEEIMINSDTVEIIARIILFFIVWGITYMLLKMVCEMSDDHKKREKHREAKQLYIARKHQFEDKPASWKRWRDANYKITDLVEADTYY